MRQYTNMKVYGIEINKNTLIFVALVIFTLLFLRQCNQTSSLRQELENTKKTAEIHYNNLMASNDSLRHYRTENGNLIAERRSFVYDIKEFEDKYSNLSKEYSKQLDLNGKLDKTNTLLKTQIELHNSINVDPTVIVSDTGTTFKFNKFDDFGNGNNRTFVGLVKFKPENNSYKIEESTFDISQNINLYAAIEEINGYKQVRIASTYPGLNVNSIENINLINNKLNEKTPKRGRWSIGAGVGYGMSLVNGQVIQFGPNISVGLFWSPSFLQFGK